uniref:GTPase Der-like n=1 Tax=Nicotiana tabacum TaxID=4097 RepID=A0A1S3YHP5_TOBAC|nr:PREDICTED: GTPase Der-like [Nicotiana tabacum]
MSYAAWFRAARKIHYSFSILSRVNSTASASVFHKKSICNEIIGNLLFVPIDFGFPSTKIGGGTPVSVSKHYFFQNIAKFCTLLGQERADDEDFNIKAAAGQTDGRPQAKHPTEDLVDFTWIHINKLPTVVIIGRPNVGKSALFYRLIRRREALVYNTPTDHVTWDIREGVAKLGDLRFKVLDSAGLEAEASSGSVLRRTAEMTGNVLSRSQFALFLVDARDGLQLMDLDVGKWLRKNAPGMKTIVVMNKAESLDDYDGSLAAVVGESYILGFGDPVAFSAETGLGMAELHETLRPLLEEYVLQNVNEEEFFPRKCLDHLPLYLPMLASESAFSSDMESHLHLASSNVTFVCFEISLLLHGQIEY